MKKASNALSGRFYWFQCATCHINVKKLDHCREYVFHTVFFVTLTSLSAMSNLVHGF
jgi:hypothetical protein